MKNMFLAIAMFFALNTTAMAEGLYAAVDLGQVSYTTSNMQSNIPSNPAPDFPKPKSWRIGGGYHFSPYFSVEADYSTIGDSTVNFNTPGGLTTLTLKASSLQAAAVCTYSFNDMFDVFGKLGAVNTKLDISLSAPGNTGYGSASKTNLLLGLGAQFNINQHFGIRAMYEDFGKTRMALTSSIGNVTTQDYGVKVISLGVVYNF